MYSVTDARTEATNSKCNYRIRRHSYNTVNRSAKSNDDRNMRNCNSGALAREARSGAPWVKKCGKLPIRENLVIT